MKRLIVVHLLIAVTTGLCRDVKLGSIAESFKVRGSKEENKLLGEMENGLVGNVEKLLTGKSDNILKDILTGADFSGKLKPTISNGDGGFHIRRQKMDSGADTQGKLLSHLLWRDLKEVKDERKHGDGGLVDPIESFEHSETVPKVIREYIRATGGEFNEKTFFSTLKNLHAEDLVIEPSVDFIRSFSEFKKELKRRVHLIKRHKWRTTTTTTSTATTTAEIQTTSTTTTTTETPTTTSALPSRFLEEAGNKESVTEMINDALDFLADYFIEHFGVGKSGRELGEVLSVLDNISAMQLSHESPAAIIEKLKELLDELTHPRKWRSTTTTTSTMSTTSEMSSTTTTTSTMALRSRVLEEGNIKSLTDQIDHALDIFTDLFTDYFGVGKRGRGLGEIGILGNKPTPHLSHESPAAIIEKLKELLDGLPHPRKWKSTTTTTSTMSTTSEMPATTTSTTTATPPPPFGLAFLNRKLPTKFV